jgi:hypothetical protein
MKRRALIALACLSLLWGTIAGLSSGQGQGGTFGHNPPNNGTSVVLPKLGLPR